MYGLIEYDGEKYFAPLEDLKGSEDCLCDAIEVSVYEDMIPLMKGRLFNADSGEYRTIEKKDFNKVKILNDQILYISHYADNSLEIYDLLVDVKGLNEEVQKLIDLKQDFIEIYKQMNEYKFALYCLNQYIESL